jgi:hypothetical protein
LSEGALVEASVRGRVLGIPLLKIDALIALVPANPTPVVRALPAGPTLTKGSGSRPLEAPGSALSEAIQSLDEAAELLAEARLIGSD